MKLYIIIFSANFWVKVVLSNLNSLMLLFNSFKGHGGDPSTKTKLSLPDNFLTYLEIEAKV
jgi:hypothetical protein